MRACFESSSKPPSGAYFFTRPFERAGVRREGYGGGGGGGGDACNLEIFSVLVPIGKTF